MVSCLSKDKLTRLTERSLKTNANMKYVKANSAIVIGTHLSKDVTAYLYKVHGNKATITLVSPSKDQFATRDGLKELVMASDSQVYVPCGVISDANVSSAKEARLSFTELRSDGQGGVLTGHWFNFNGEQIIKVSSDEEIQALKEGKQLACAS